MTPICVIKKRLFFQNSKILKGAIWFFNAFETIHFCPRKSNMAIAVVISSKLVETNPKCIHIKLQKANWDFQFASNGNVNLPNINVKNVFYISLITFQTVKIVVFLKSCQSYYNLISNITVWLILITVSPSSTCLLRTVNLPVLAVE